MSEVLRPAAEWELQSVLARVVSSQQTLEVVGHGALKHVGRPVTSDVVLTTASLRGITLYEPNELVMSARAGTLLSDIERELSSRRQMLAFEPVDISTAIGSPHSHLSIGGVFATNFSGARRLSAGSARDHLLGVRAVNGRAELLKSGGRVMKNVTGLDVARGLAGSWGTLAVMTEVTFKVVPQPEASATLVFSGLTDELAAEVMTTATGTPFDVSGAAHLHAALARRLRASGVGGADRSLTLIRLENFQSGLDERVVKLRSALGVYGTPAVLDTQTTLSVWAELRALSIMPYAPDRSLWRISTAPTYGPAVVAAIQRSVPADAYFDWAGGLIWLDVPEAADAGASDIRRAVAVRGGHATLIRANPGVRANVEVFEPMLPDMQRLASGLKTAFDPAGILNRGRMYAAM